MNRCKAIKHANFSCLITLKTLLFKLNISSNFYDVHSFTQRIFWINMVKYAQLVPVGL